MKSINSLIKDDVQYRKEGNIVHFILDEQDRPGWSKALNHHLVTNKIDLKMSQRYESQREIMMADEKRRRFFDFISAEDGVKVDLASGPSGYFSPVLDALGENDIFIATDACPSVITAHSAACRKENFFVFDLDLDQELPFTDNKSFEQCRALCRTYPGYIQMFETGRTVCRDGNVFRARL